MSARETPVMQQHAAAKRAYPDAVVFFRLGDFYEMFGDDAILCAKLLDLTLTSRNKGKPDEVPMAGVPHHAAHGYIGKLLEIGRKVAICEQMADPKLVKGIVPREVVRVLTPGTVTNPEHLEGGSNHWLLTIELDEPNVGVALLDVSTGELFAAEFPDLASVLGEMARSSPREIVLAASPTASAELLDGAARAVNAAAAGVAVRRDAPLTDGELQPILGKLASDVGRLRPVVTRAVCRCLRYARSCNPGVELPTPRIAEWSPSEHLLIDAAAQRHLEIVESPGGKQATLLATLDATSTPLGARLLRRRLVAPLVDVPRIRRRLDLVELFVESPSLRRALRETLSNVTDLERLSMRAVLGEATPRDMGALRDGLDAAARAISALDAIQDPIQRETLGIGADPVDAVPELCAELSRALVDRPPVEEKDGAIFRPGYDAELDLAQDLRKKGTDLMIELEGRLREETGIPSLKVRFTRVFGWYVELTRAQVTRAPESWRRKQTVASGERFTLPELDDLADRISHAEERHRERELALFRDLVHRVAATSERIMRLSERIATWDVAAGLAEIAHRHDYRRPDVDDSSILEIVDGRHPVVERLAAAGQFVPNDVNLSADGERIWIVTGPNMAGKSTLLRQVALSVLMAQMGSFVPARSARLGTVDRILSRVGASDNLSRGESTFMVEMRETAEILRKATRRSLVILDEIGRGTSTFDGLSIAWAVAEHLDQRVGARTLFATHYHELTALAEASEHVANVSVSAEEIGTDIVLLHRLVRGPASRSFGVAVARLAGLPESVLARARALLQMLEAGGANPVPPGSAKPITGKPHGNPPQLDLFSAAPPATALEHEVLATLRATDVERMTPIDAIALLAKLKERLR